MTTKKRMLEGLVHKTPEPTPAPVLPGVQLSAKIDGERYRKLATLKVQTRKSHTALVNEALDLLFEAHHIE